MYTWNYWISLTNNTTIKKNSEKKDWLFLTWIDIITIVLQDIRGSKKSWNQREIVRCYAVDIEDGERAVSQEMLVATRNWNRRGNGFSLSASRRNQSCRQLDFSPLSHQAFDLQNYRQINFFLLNPSLMFCYSSNSNVIQIFIQWFFWEETDFKGLDPLILLALSKAFCVETPTN